MLDMHIQKEELSNWMTQEPRVTGYLLEGYKNTISDISSNILKDSRSLNNEHIVNSNFTTEPKYMMGFIQNRERHEFILSCLYVFPKFRRQGFGVSLVRTAQQIVRDQGFIQVAVEKDKVDKLDAFYRQLGFITTGDIIQNTVGKCYQDYFWSGKKISLKRQADTILVTPHNA